MTKFVNVVVHSGFLLGDDTQLLIWDIAATALSPRQHRSPAMAASPHLDTSQSTSRVLTDPTLAYAAPSEINNLTWSPPMGSMNLGGVPTSGGEWIAIAAGRTIKALKV